MLYVASPPAAEAAGGDVSLLSERPIFVSLYVLKGHENDVLTGISIEFVSQMVRGVCTRLD